jgi:hypothetical protein
MDRRPARDGPLEDDRGRAIVEQPRGDVPLQAAPRGKLHVARPDRYVERQHRKLETLGPLSHEPGAPSGRRIAEECFHNIEPDRVADVEDAVGQNEAVLDDQRGLRKI